MAGRGLTPLTTQVRRTLAAHDASQRTGIPVDEVLGSAREAAARREVTRRDAVRAAGLLAAGGVVAAAATRPAPARAAEPDVVVVGAGLAGLRAAHWLWKVKGIATHGLRGLDPARRPVLDAARPLPRLRRRARRRPDQHRPHRGAQPRAQPRPRPRHRQRRQLRGVGRQVLDRRRELPLRRGQRRLGAGLARGQERPQGRAVPADLRLVDPRRPGPGRPDGRPVARRERARAGWAAGSRS